MDENMFRYAPPGPLCSARLGTDWVDDGTMARTRSRVPGPQCTALEASVSGSNFALNGYPKETAHLAAWLIREGYIRTLTSTLPAHWAAMNDAELTSYLTAHYNRDHLIDMYLKRYSQRMNIKVGFRRLNVVAAVLIGVIWARENIKNGDWGTALAKVGASGAGAVVVNRLLYARDATAAELMAKKADNFGAWFKGAARANFRVNLLVRLTFLTDIAKMSLSGGGEYPSIPWDIIYDIDVNDESTWRPPSNILLSLGFNIWYRLKDTNIYLGYVEGSLIKTVLENTILSKPAY